MKQLTVMLKNSGTSIFGFLTGVALYITNVGPKIPTNEQEWMNLLAAIFLAGMGVAAKDATTGSKPK